jgi:hypothetical protein
LRVSTEIDLFSFDVPAPAPTAPPSNDFGAFQATPAATPAQDDEFGAFVASKTSSQPDPFAAPIPAPSSFDAFRNNGGAAPVQDDEFGAFEASKTSSQPDPFATPVPVPSTFDAFGNNGGAAAASVVAPIPAMAPSMMQNNNTMGGNMNNMNQAFGNMNIIQTLQPAPAVGDNDFGDFSSAPRSFSTAAPTNRADPMSKLVSLDGLSKNPVNKQRKWYYIGRNRAFAVILHIHLR